MSTVIRLGDDAGNVIEEIVPRVPYLTVACSMLSPHQGIKTLPKKLLPLILSGIAVTSLLSVRPAQLT